MPLHLIYQKALVNGLIGKDARLAHQDVAELVFVSGLSTAGQLTQISGRGVGMDAARAFLQKAGCEIKINLKAAPGKNDALSYTPFEFVITIPEGKYLLPSGNAEEIRIRASAAGRFPPP